MEARVALLTLAAFAGVRKQRLFKLVRRLRIRTVQYRHAAHRGQFIATVSIPEAERLHAELRR